MSPNDHMGGGGADGRTKSYVFERPQRRWLKTAQEGNRFEFEREMERNRSEFAGEFKRFWRRHRPAS